MGINFSLQPLKTHLYVGFPLKTIMREEWQLSLVFPHPLLLEVDFQSWGFPLGVRVLTIGKPTRRPKKWALVKGVDLAIDLYVGRGELYARHSGLPHEYGGL